MMPSVKKISGCLRTAWNEARDAVSIKRLSSLDPTEKAALAYILGNGTFLVNAAILACQTKNFQPLVPAILYFASAGPLALWGKRNEASAQFTGNLVGISGSMVFALSEAMQDNPDMRALLYRGAIISGSGTFLRYVFDTASRHTSGKFSGFFNNVSRGMAFGMSLNSLSIKPGALLNAFCGEKHDYLYGACIALWTAGDLAITRIPRLTGRAGAIKERLVSRLKSVIPQKKSGLVLLDLDATPAP